MFTLAFVDTLSTGRLAPTPIAGTGTIDSRGYVGEIGGVAYKVDGAIAAGAKVFFTPIGDAPAARAEAKGRIKIVQVGTVGDALNWLCTHKSADAICSSPTLTARLLALHAINSQ